MFSIFIQISPYLLKSKSPKWPLSPKSGILLWKLALNLTSIEDHGLHFDVNFNFTTDKAMIKPWYQASISLGFYSKPTLTLFWSKVPGSSVLLGYNMQGHYLYILLSISTWINRYAVPLEGIRNVICLFKDAPEIMQIKRVKEVIICKSLFINSLAVISQSPLVYAKIFRYLLLGVFDVPQRFPLPSSALMLCSMSPY